VDPKLLNSTSAILPPTPVQANDTPPAGTLKSILPCTPLAVIKCLEYAGVYNQLLKYGNRAFGKTVTVINRSEVVGRPLAALLANDGARVFSVDIDSIQEYTKRPKVGNPGQSTEGVKPKRTFHPSHVVHACKLTLEECLAVSDVVISAVPSLTYKVSTDGLKDGCIAVNVAGEKNFEDSVREKASFRTIAKLACDTVSTGICIPSSCRKGYNLHAAEKLVSSRKAVSTYLMF
jgi:methylenetetrahydrofolate dehydrogenase (NAD+)